MKPRRTPRSREQPNAAQSTDGCLTDPEPGMDSRQAAVRNMRSKCRCSCVLQFTFRRAVSCVLHRPPSQVIHCTVLFSQVCLSKRARLREKDTQGSTSQNGKGPNSGKGERSLGGLILLGCPRSTAPKTRSRRTDQGTSTAPRPEPPLGHRQACRQPEAFAKRPESCISS